MAVAAPGGDGDKKKYIENIIEESKFCVEGRAARKAKKGLEDNPYDVLTKTYEHNEWTAGWDFEDYELQGSGQ
jgi:hypothetical protein